VPFAALILQILCFSRCVIQSANPVLTTATICWQLNSPVPIKPKADLIKRIPKLGTDAFVELEDTDLVSELFPSPPKKHLHIVAQLSSGESHTFMMLH